MKNRVEFRDIILSAVGDDSPEMIILANEVINQAIVMGALIFDPPELQVKYDYTLPSAEVSFSLTSSPFNSEVLVIRSIKDVDNLRRIWYINPDKWDVIVPTLTTVKFFTLHGTTVYVNTSLVTSLDLEVKATKYPALFVDDTTDCQYDFHDDFIISTATNLLFAKMEEKETVEMWTGVQSSIAAVHSVGLSRRMANLMPGVTKKGGE